MTYQLISDGHQPVGTISRGWPNLLADGCFFGGRRVSPLERSTDRTGRCLGQAPSRGNYSTGFSIVLRCRVTPPLAELRQTLPVDAIDLGLHLRMPALDRSRPPPQQSRSRKSVKSAG